MKLMFIVFLVYFHEVASQTTSNNDDKLTLAAIRKLVCNDNTNTNEENGKSGANCDVIEKIEMLDRENKLLSQQVSTLQQAHDDFIAKFNETIFGYTFKITPNRGTFDDCRKQCQQLGGDLIQWNFGANGFKYHSLLRKLMETSGKNLWIGMTDRVTEGTWKYLNGIA